MTIEIENRSPIQFEEVSIVNDYMGDKVIDIRNTVTDIDVFEHLDKPYLTSVLSFVDTADVISSGLIQGGELVKIKLKADMAESEFVSFEKKFRISKVLMSQKANDTQENVVLHLVEEHAFKANHININRSFSGQPQDIIANMAKDVDKTVKVKGTPNQKSMRVIVPNLNPIESMAWIKNATSTKDGYPFYLYSTLIGDDLQFADLETLMNGSVINPEYPYSHIQANIPDSMDTEKVKENIIRRRTILGYQQRSVDTLFEMIAKGLVASDYTVIDTVKNERFRGEHDIQKDVVSKLDTKTLSYFSATGLNKQKSRNITQLKSTWAQDTFETYGQEKDYANYKLDMVNQAMDAVLKKSPLIVSVNFIDFMKGDVNNSIGNKIRLRFLRNIDDANEQDDRFDKKKSGDFLIFATKHSFRRENYVATHSCVKLANEEVVTK